MQLNSHATNQDIVSDIKFWLTGSYNGTIDYDINDIVRNVNRRYDEVASTILRADGRWQWDDDNFTNLPIGYTDLVDGQQDYGIPVADFLTVLEVAVKKTDGKWQVLTSTDRNKGNAQRLSTLEDGNSGLPLEYDKIASSLFLYPLPSSSQVLTGTDSQSLRVSCQRNASYFVVGDTTKTPGFAAPFHRILSVGAALDYCIANGLSKKQNTLEGELKKLEDGLVAFYASRSRDEQVRLGLQTEDYGGEAGRVISEDKFNV